MNNFKDDGIQQHPDFLKLYDIRPSLLSRTISDIGKYVYTDKPYSKEFAEEVSHKIEVNGDTLSVDNKYIFDTYDICSTDSSMGDYQVYWFGNFLVFYKDDKYMFALNQLESLKFLHYGETKVSTYSLLMDKVNIKDHFEHVYARGCVALDFIGPWTPYWFYYKDGYKAIIAQNMIIESEGGLMSYNERFGVKNGN